MNTNHNSGWFTVRETHDTSIYTNYDNIHVTIIK